MENNKLAKTLNTSLQVKSLKDLVRVRSSESSVLLLDCSASMSWPMRNGRERISGLRDVVRQIQESRPTQMIAFGPPRYDGISIEDYARAGKQAPHGMEPEVAYFVNEVPDPNGGTPLKQAIEFASKNGAGRIILISDGAPADPSGCMDAARAFGGQIDVYFVGDPGDHGSHFLDALAQATGGKRFEGDLSEPKAISAGIVGLLGGAILEEVDEDEDDEDEDDDDETE
jgi:hypothetical protein